MPPVAETPAIDKSRLFARLAEGSPASTVVITPNLRLASTLGRDHDYYQASRALVAWESADILPFSSFVERLHEDALYSEFAMQAEGGLSLLLSAAEEQHLWQGVIEDSEWRGLLLSGAQAAAQCRESWQLAHAWRIAGALADGGGAWLPGTA